MQLMQGFWLNWRGFWLGVRTPRLLVLGMLRFAAVIVLTVATASVILHYHDVLMTAVWSRPESLWLVWVWYLANWLLTALLVVLATILAYLLAQVLFAVWIMDRMSRITEKMVRGRAVEPPAGSLAGQFAFLVAQEIPRAVAPLLLTLVVVVLGWLTPLGPVVTIVSPLVAGTLLAWDNTDLLPARQLLPFRRRFHMFYRHLGFHIGFGLPFLIPVVNLLLLSFAPVGATLYHLEREAAATDDAGREKAGL